ncbi:MAG: putative Rossmann fold nucleotide-binding protein [Candidatus Methanohalarchaeum thermophilum]|uniref:Rossmann fold nucleotide-binding protein n=1 Tax=Methanohalarchaeum thermophilum TaxID=1903181 RepID=A0A1Q6DS24_METT1|nr:MAG: putative Rossmann fold nucleotide-binding protein [Candidatus Methanohalarchaeum thermophilum]
MHQIGVIGSGSCEKETKKKAYELGKEIAEHGVLVCGGLGGVMKSASKGCKEAGGETIGILPGDDISSANQYIDHKIVTGLGEARNVVIVKSSDVLVSVEGGYGTLSEISLAKKLGKDVIGTAGGFSKELSKLGLIDYFSDPRKALKTALS